MAGTATTLRPCRIRNRHAAAARNPGNNRRLGYSLEQIQAFRKHFDATLPLRDPARAPLVIACQNSRVASAKSTTCVNFAHYRH